MVKMNQSFTLRPWKMLLYKKLDPGENISADLGEIRFDRLAEAMGAHGERVQRNEDLAAAIDRALRSGRPAVIHLDVDPGGQFIAPAGIFNLAGDGWMTIDEIAARLKKPVRRWSPLLLKILFGILKPIGISRYGPEQVRFLQYRPVLDNAGLKGVFGYVPQKTSAEAFNFYCKAQIDGKNGTSGTKG